VSSRGVSARASWAVSWRSAIEPGRRPVNQEKVTVVFAQGVAQLSKSCTGTTPVVREMHHAAMIEHAHGRTMTVTLGGKRQVEQPARRLHRQVVDALLALLVDGILVEYQDRFAGRPLTFSSRW